MKHCKSTWRLLGILIVFMLITQFVSAQCPSGSVIPSLSASSTQVQAGQQVSLSWSSPGGFICTASNGWSGSLSNSGSRTVTVNSTTTYRIDCGGQLSGGGCNQVTVNAIQPAPPTASISANPTSVRPGQFTDLSWSATVPAGGGCTGSWKSGALALNGQQTINNLTATTTFTITCTGGGQSVSKSVTVSVSGLAVCAPAWSANVVYTTGELVSYRGNNYKCLQPHTSLTGWDPIHASTLWGLIGACQ